MKKTNIVVVAGLACAGLWPGRAGVIWPVNGHYYEAVLFSGSGSWTQARDAAISRGGYLATLTSAEETAFVFDLVKHPAFWFNDGANNSQGPWLGGSQPPPRVEPAGNWQWITGETWSYQNWSAGEPNNSGGDEHYLQFFGAGLNHPAATWNDVGASSPVRGYVLEMVPEPASAAVMTGLLLGVAAAGRRLGRQDR
jgi:hypothetical protein